MIGDGPAGRSLGAACVLAGLDTVVVGRDAPWTSTYAVWADEVPAHVGSFAATMTVDAVGHRRTTLSRTYAVLDNRSFRASIDVAPHVTAHVGAVDHLHDVSVVRCSGSDSDLSCRIVIDARGTRSEIGVPVQTAYGLVLRERPKTLEGDGGLLMDWRQPVGATLAGGRSRGMGEIDHPTFLYVVQLGNGRWLVEETSLAHHRPIRSEVLRARLASRLGADLTESALAVEHVAIPLRSGRPLANGQTVLFGAAAGYVHPATGYSVAASLRAAERVADSIATSLPVPDPLERSAAVRAAVWPSDHVRARALHDYGLAALLRLKASDVQTFFDAFFALPVDQWSAYLRVDTDGRDVARAMTKVFTTSPWRLRLRLASGNPGPFLRLGRAMLQS